MEDKIKVLIVEDEMIIGAKISLTVEQMGYQVSGIIPRGEEAIVNVESNQPDIILMDINLSGELDGIETAKRIKEKYNIPIIYLTANADDSHFDRAKETKPEAFISKPYRTKELSRVIELALSRANDESVSSIASQFQLKDRIFVKTKERRVKLLIEDISYIESDRNYVNIHSKDKIYTLAVTLKVIESKLPAKHFIRVHRSYIVNQGAIDAIADGYVVIQKHVIPVSKVYKELLAERLKII